MTPEEKKQLKKAIDALQQLAATGADDDEVDRTEPQPETPEQKARNAQRIAMGLRPIGATRPKMFRATPNRLEFSQHNFAQARQLKVRA